MGYQRGRDDVRVDYWHEVKERELNRSPTIHVSYPAKVEGGRNRDHSWRYENGQRPYDETAYPKYMVPMSQCLLG